MDRKFTDSKLDILIKLWQLTCPPAAAIAFIFIDSFSESESYKLHISTFCKPKLLLCAKRRQVNNVCF